MPIKNKSKFKNFWVAEGFRYILVLAIVGAICGFAISFANSITAPVIVANEQARLQAMLEEMMPEADEYKLVMKDDVDVYLGIKNREILGAVVPGEGKGFYGDPVRVLTLLDSEGKIEEVLVQKHKETPGMGDKIKNPIFLSQFPAVSSGVSFHKEQEAEDILIAGVDVITGATVSSQAVIEGVAQAIDLYLALSLD